MEKSPSQRRLERLCRRFGVPIAAAERLLPLVEGAQRSKPEVRRRIFAVVEATLARDAEVLRGKRALEERLLVAVAAVLHRW